MDSPSPHALHPALLPPGTVVGAWRVQAWAGRGAYGAVYRAVPLHNEHASPVALKLALQPGDPRFAREVALLSQSDHPSIPRLVDHGSWQSPSGTLHPFLVMQWVDGAPLYEQARLQPPAPARVRLWLAQLAQALASLHAQGALHRDLKGDNVLVRRCDEQGTWQLKGVRLPPALLRSPDVEPSVRALILRVLSVRPEQRGTAAQLAQELEPASPVRPSRPPLRTRAPRRQAWLWLPAAAAGLALAVWAGRTVSHESPEQPSVARAEPARPDSADAGTAGLGDAATVAAQDKVPSGSTVEGMSEDTLPEPQPGQVRPDEKGRCPGKGLVALNGGCWNETAWEPEKCQELGGQMFKGTCYVPFIPPGRKRPPTSGPLKNP